LFDVVSLAVRAATQAPALPAFDLAQAPVNLCNSLIYRRVLYHNTIGPLDKLVDKVFTATRVRATRINADIAGSASSLSNAPGFTGTAGFTYISGICSVAMALVARKTVTLFAKPSTVRFFS
jgi:hypothetical protein